MASDPTANLTGGDLTRHRILVAASRMFAERGYHGTSTTQIAEAVGIRQPSLFFHFPSKQAIAAELLELDLRPAMIRLVRALELDGSPAARLLAYVQCEMTALSSASYDMRGPYSEAVLEEPGLEPWRELRAKYHKLMRRLIRQGQAGGELRDVDPVVTQELLTAIFIQTIWSSADDRGDRNAKRVATQAEIVLRGLLADGIDIESVIEEAGAVARRIEQSVDS